MVTKVQVIGLCRFSLFSEGGFQAMPEDAGERRERLFDPVRLEQRMRWFEAVTLPSIAAQNDPDFLFLVVTSEDLPEPFMTRLRLQVAKVPQARLMPLPYGLHREQCGEAIRQLIDPGVDTVAQFRLDDDDGVSMDFVGLLKRRYERLAPAFNRKELFAIDFQKGFLLSPSADRLELTLVQAHLWTPGLALYFAPNHVKSVMDFPHHRVWRFMPVVSHPHLCIFLRGNHSDNDSGDLVSYFPLENNRHPNEDVLKERFGREVGELAKALLTPLSL